MEILPLVQVYGPLGLGWVIAGYLLKFVLDRYNADIEAKVKLATSLDGLAKIIEDLGRHRA